MVKNILEEKSNSSYGREIFTKNPESLKRRYFKEEVLFPVVVKYIKNTYEIINYKILLLLNTIHTILSGY